MRSGSYTHLLQLFSGHQLHSGYIGWEVLYKVPCSVLLPGSTQQKLIAWTMRWGTRWLSLSPWKSSFEMGTVSAICHRTGHARTTRTTGGCLGAGCGPSGGRLLPLVSLLSGQGPLHLLTAVFPATHPKPAHSRHAINTHWISFSWCGKAMKFFFILFLYPEPKKRAFPFQ